MLIIFVIFKKRSCFIGVLSILIIFNSLLIVVNFFLGIDCNIIVLIWGFILLMKYFIMKSNIIFKYVDLC